MLKPSRLQDMTVATAADDHFAEIKFDATNTPAWRSTEVSHSPP
jgi:hypothetical protein